MNKTSYIVCFIVFATLLAAACETREDPTVNADGVQTSRDKARMHPAGDAAERFLQALQYGDPQTAVEAHAESTHKGFYCQSEEFQRVFDAARARADEDSCRDAKALDNAALAQLDDDARLAAQMLKVVCEQPDATCADYSSRVLEAQRDAWPTWTQTLQRFDIERVLGKDDEAVVYVDVYATPRGSPDHRALKMTRIDDRWYVSERLLESGVGEAGPPPVPPGAGWGDDSTTEADFN